MKRALILFSALVMITVIVGCKTTPQDEEPAPEPVAAEPVAGEPDVVPFGLTLKWKVDRIPYDDAWIKLDYLERRYPKNGILVKEVLVNTQAVERGFRPNDIIYLVDNKGFTTTSQFVNLISRLKPGHEAPVMVVRTQPDNKKELVQLSLKVATSGIRKFDFPILYGYNKNEHFKSSRCLVTAFYNRQLFSCRTWGFAPLFVPLYHRERIGNVVTQRVLWIFRWRVGPEDEITI